MARYTTESEPLAVTYSDNPLEFIFYSEQFNGDDYDFKYKIEVYVEGTLVYTGFKRSDHYYKPPFLNERFYTKYDVSNIIKAFANNPTYTEAFVTNVPKVSYYIEWTPSNENPTLGTIIEATQTSSTRYAIKGRLSLEDWLKHTSGTILSFSNTTPNYASQYPATEKYYVEENKSVFCYVPSNNNTTDTIRIKTYDINSALVDTVTYSYTATTDNILVNGSIANIVAATSLTTSDFNSIYYYTVEVGNAGTGNYSTAQPFYIDRLCDKYTAVRAYFLGKSGALEAFSFKLVSRQKANITRAYKRQTVGNWQNNTLAGPSYTATFERNLTEGENINYDNEELTTIEVNSDYINEAVQKWLVENIAISPYIILDYNGSVQRVHIKDTSYEVLKRENDKLINQRFIFELSNINKSSLL